MQGQPLAHRLGEAKAILVGAVRILSHYSPLNYRNLFHVTQRAQYRFQKGIFLTIQIKLCLLLEISGITNIFYFLKLSGRNFSLQQLDVI